MIIEQDDTSPSPCLLFCLPPELFLLCCSAFTPKNLSVRSPRQRLYFNVDRVVNFKDIRFLRQEEEGETAMLFSYLDFKDWLQLDAAVTNRKLRVEYLRMIEHTTISFPEILSLQYSYKFGDMMRWIQQRKLRLNTLYLTASTIQQLQLQHTFPSDVSNIYKLRCETPNKEQCLFAWNYIAKEMPNLTLLDLTNNQKMTSSALKLIMKHCPRMKSLSLSACKYIKDNTLNKIANYANSLQYFDISKCEVSFSALMNFIKKLPNLVSLNVTSCRFSYKQIAELLEQCPLLEELLANYPEFAYSNPSKEALDVDLLAGTLSRLGKHLFSLSLKNCRILQDVHLLQILTSCENLKKLSLEGCSMLTDEIISRIGVYCEGMVALDLRNCSSLSDEGVVSLATRLSKCRDLAIDGCYKLTDKAILALQNNAKDSHGEEARISLRVTFTHCPRVHGFDSSILIVQR